MVVVFGGDPSPYPELRAWQQAPPCINFWITSIKYCWWGSHRDDERLELVVTITLQRRLNNKL
jgi:hypothetical protein